MSVDIVHYGDQFYKDYMSGDFEVTLTKYRKRKIVALMEKYKASDILEIGCGMEPIFLKYGGFASMTIVEPAPQMYESAGGHIENTQNKDRVTLINDFLENVTDKLTGVPFDFILDIGLIHEVEDCNAHVEAIKNLCGRDTKVLFVTSNSESFHLMLAYESGLIKSPSDLTEKAKGFQRHRTFNMRQMEDFIHGFGFRVLEKGSYFIKPFSHAQMKRLVDEAIISTQVLDGLDRMVKYMPELGAELYIVAEIDNDSVILQ